MQKCFLEPGPTSSLLIQREQETATRGGYLPPAKEVAGGFHAALL